MIFTLTSQKRGGYTRAVIEIYDTAAEALDALAMYCPEDSMDSFIPGRDSVLSLRNKILRAEILNDEESARGWTLRFPPVNVVGKDR